jgi:hypothetical protein
VIPNLASLPYEYISTASLTSTVEGLGSKYVSSAALIAMVSNYSNSISFTNAQLVSSIANLGTKGYYSTPSLVSTLNGLGTFRYVSLESLISSNTSISNIYVTSNTVPQTYTTIQTNETTIVSPLITSTVRGLGSLVTPTGYGYISSPAGYTGVPTYLGIPSYISCLQAAENVGLRSTTTGFATRLGSLPAITYSNLTIQQQANSPLFIYSASTRSSVPSLTSIVVPDGIKMSNVYCFCNVASSTFYADTYYADGTQLVYSSDSRLKFDITPLSNALDSLSLMEGISYRMIAEPDKEYLGFIAQDIEKVYPELVFTYNTMKTLKYDSIGVILLEAIKELNIHCDELLSTIASLSSTKEVCRTISR